MWGNIVMGKVYEYDKEALVIDLNEMQSDWYVKLTGDYITIYNQNVDEDFSEEIELPQTLLELNDDLWRLYDNFDVDEHVEMWLEAKRSGNVDGIPSARVLVEESERIDRDLEELARLFSNAIMDDDFDQAKDGEI